MTVFSSGDSWDVSHLRRSQIAKFMGPTWGPPGSCRPQMDPILAPWTLLSGFLSNNGLGLLPWTTIISIRYYQLGIIWEYQALRLGVLPAFGAMDWPHVDGLVQERRNSSALAMELRLSCTNPSMYASCIQVQRTNRTSPTVLLSHIPQCTIRNRILHISVLNCDFGGYRISGLWNLWIWSDENDALNGICSVKSKRWKTIFLWLYYFRNAFKYE